MMTEVTKQRNVTIIRLDQVYDSLDDRRIDDLGKLLLEQAETAEPAKLLVDMQSTEFIGSSFIEVLFRAWKHTSDRGGRLVLGGVSPFCDSVFKAAQVDSIFDIYADTAAAQRSLEADSVPD